MSQLNSTHTRNLSKLPKLTLITCGYKDIKQTYEHIDHVIIEDTPVRAFNQGLQISNNEWCGFLDDKFDFIDDKVVEIMMTTVANYPELSGIYTDNITNDIRNYYPSCNHAVLGSPQLIINTPIFFKKQTNIKFNDTPNYYADVIRGLSQISILHHIPQALFIQNQSELQNKPQSKPQSKLQNELQ